MKVLFVHQNFPGQFKFLAPALAAKGHDVLAMTLQKVPLAKSHEQVWRGVRLCPYSIERSTSPAIHPWASDFETKVIRGEACFRAALGLKAQGFVPDLIIAHPGWGESLFLKDVWPDARLGIYCEFYYGFRGADVGFDPEFETHDPGEACRLRLKNVNNLLHLNTADAGLSPTYWQASTFPESFQKRIRVIHDGIDTEKLVSNPSIGLSLQTANGTISLSRLDEVVTFVSRNLEPYRGYHSFMRSLPELLRRRPKARVIIVGGNEVSYGAPPPKGQTWRDIFLDEVKAGLDLSRVHFVGKVPYPTFLALLQVSSVHAYLTYPFVLSWSLLEAMSAGCAIVASDTQPLHEAIRHGETGRLVNFFDASALAREVCTLLDDPSERARLGRRARKFAQENYDLKTVCLPQQMAWVQSLFE